MLTSWDWTEIAEGVAVSLAFWAIGLEMGRRHLKRKVVDPAARRHEEQMAAHARTHRHLTGGDPE